MTPGRIHVHCQKLLRSSEFTTRAAAGAGAARHLTRVAAAAMAVVAALGIAPPAAAQTNIVTAWNVVASSATGNWRAPTIAHLAIHDALNAIDRRFEPYAVDLRAPAGTSPEAAVSAAARRVLLRLVPEASVMVEAAYDQSLAAIPPGSARDAGVALGEAVADRLVELRADDGFYEPAVYLPIRAPGAWRPTPPAFAPAATPEWATMRPFAMRSADQFRPAPPPLLTDAIYAAAHDEVRRLGAVDSTERTADQTMAAQYWAQLTQPAYNRIVRAVLEAHPLDTWEQARLFALVNMAIADANISTWDAKYAYGFWRPITAIREGDTDGNDLTLTDTTWQPLLNTPNHPDYAAGHSGASGAAVRAIQLVLGTDTVATTTIGGFGVTRS
jgi:hypothetical protein